MTTSDHGSTPAASHAAETDLAPPENVQELRQEIEDTRERLSDTVQQLAARADVTARARDKAVELTQKVKGTASRAQAPVWDATPEPVRQALAKGATTVRQRRGPLAAAASVLVAICLVVRWRRRN